MIGRYGLYIVGLIVVNVVLSQLDWRWDLTEDKRYSMSSLSEDMVEDVDEDIVITVFFDGDLPPSFQAYRDYIDHYLNELRRLNSRFEIIYKNPLEGSTEERNEVAQYLKSYGVTPISRRVKKGESLSQNVIYPYLSVHSRKRVVFIDLFEAKRPNQSESEALLAAQINLESKLIRAVRDVSGETSGLVGVVGDGHVIMANALNNEKGKLGSYFFFPMNAAQLLQQADTLDAIIAVAKTQGPDRESLFAIDQCMMRGVPVLWMIDKYPVRVDSIGRYGSYTAIPKEYEAEDLLFKHGVRVTADLVSSLDCGAIPQVVGQEGGTAKTELIRYPFHPLLKQKSDWIMHVSEPVMGQFVTTIDTLRTKNDISRKAILETSEYSRLSRAPVMLDFESLRYEMNADDYGAGAQMVGLALQGEFGSYFSENRLTAEDKMALESAAIDYSSISNEVREVILTDVDSWWPSVGRDGSLYPLGYSYWERTQYRGNRDFLRSALEYLVHGTALVSLSQREISTPLIDKVKWANGRLGYILFMILVPVLCSIILLVFIRQYRKVKYA